LGGVLKSAPERLAGEDEREQSDTRRHKAETTALHLDRFTPTVKE